MDGRDPSIAAARARPPSDSMADRQVGPILSTRVDAGRERRPPRRPLRFPFTGHPPPARRRPNHRGGVCPGGEVRRGHRRQRLGGQAWSAGASAVGFSTDETAAHIVRARGTFATRFFRQVGAQVRAQRPSMHTRDAGRANEIPAGPLQGCGWHTIIFQRRRLGGQWLVVTRKYLNQCAKSGETMTWRRVAGREHHGGRAHRLAHVIDPDPISTTHSLII